MNPAVLRKGLCLLLCLAFSAETSVSLSHTHDYHHGANYTDAEEDFVSEQLNSDHEAQCALCEMASTAHKHFAHASQAIALFSVAPSALALLTQRSPELALYLPFSCRAPPVG